MDDEDGDILLARLASLSVAQVDEFKGLLIHRNCAWKHLLNLPDVFFFNRR